LLLCAAALTPPLAGRAASESWSASAAASPATTRARGGGGAGSFASRDDAGLFQTPADTWIGLGPVAGRVLGLAVSPANPSIVYAAVDSNSGGFTVPFNNGASVNDGLYKSTDSGRTWAKTGLIGQTLLSVAADPTNAQTVYAGGFRSGVFKSVDGGQTWAGPYKPPNAQESDAYALIVHPQTPSILYAIFPGHGLYRSMDGGVTWGYVNSSGLARLSFDPQTPSTIYSAGGGTQFGGVYKSTDGGASWTRISSGLFVLSAPFTEVSSAVAVDPLNASILYVGTTIAGVYKSTDGGANWTVTGAGLPGGVVVRALVVHPTNAGAVVAATDRGVYRTTNGGASWEPTGLATVPVVSLAALPGGAGAALLAATPGLGVYASADAGATWSHSAAGLPRPLVRHLAISTSDPARLYAGTDDGLYQTFDRGDNWAFTGLTNSGRAILGLAVDPLNPSNVYAGLDFQGVFKSTNGGESFSWIFQANTNFSTLAVDPSTPSTVFWATLSRLYKSTNGGAQFSEINPPGFVSAVAVNPSNSQIVYFVSNSGISRSINGGGTIGFPTLRPSSLTHSAVKTVTIDPNDHSTIYAIVQVAAGNPRGAYRSTDGGLTWQLVFADAASQPLSIAVAPGRPGTVYAGTAAGVLRSADAGATSAPFAEGLPPATSVNALTFDAAGQYLYAGSQSGVYRLQAVPCGFLPAPAGQSFAMGGGAGTFSVTVSGAGCALAAATANVDWITVNSVTPGGGGVNSVSYTVAPNAGNRRGGVITVGNQTFNVSQAQAPATFLFGAAAYAAGESDAAGAQLTVVRAGDNTFPASVSYATVDDPAAVPCADQGTAAYARCDYATTVDTLFFAAGETAKTVRVPLIDDGHAEHAETFHVALSQPAEGAALGARPVAAVTIADNDTGATPNPIFDNAFFVRQQYLDFLSREPEQAGFDAWLGVLERCPDVNADPACDRNLVSSSFFRSAEFELKGRFVYNFYKVAFGRLPLYAEITPDMRAVTGQTQNEVFFKRHLFTEAFARRPGFKAAFDTKTNAEYVDALAAPYGLTQITTPDISDPEGSRKVTLTRAELTGRLNGGGYNRGQVLRAFAQSDEVGRAEFNRAFVAMQYFGYLRRDAEPSGFNAWLAYLDSHPGDYRTMVDGFVNSVEYVLRFGRR
jgi:photosystem II stability/assembly factor-like uncharacterized protein